MLARVSRPTCVPCLRRKDTTTWSPSSSTLRTLPALPPAIRTSRSFCMLAASTKFALYTCPPPLTTGMFWATTVSMANISRINVPAMPMGTGLRSRNGFMSARAHRVLVVDRDGCQDLLLAADGVVVGELTVRLAEEEVEPRAVGGRTRGGVDPLRQVLQLLGQLRLLRVELLGQDVQLLDVGLQRGPDVLQE